MALYNATDGPHWAYNDNWNSSAPLGTWAGVTTDPGGRVTHLRLADHGLRGTIPPALGNLAELTRLDLRDNHLTGPIPAELGRLTNLTDLELDNNGLAGSIPAELGNLTSLTRLALGNNGLTGSIPAALGNLPNLAALFLDHNSLTAIPPELGNLTSLETLYLQNNDFTGSFPAGLLDLTSLVDLRLYHNGFTGSIPAALGDLTSLDTLYLHFNSFAGTVPAALGRLTRLLNLTLGQNLLTGELPQTFTNLTALSSFRGQFTMDHNDGLCAPTNPEFQAWLRGIFNFVGDTCGNVSTLPRRPFTVTVAPASIPGGVIAPATFEVRWASTADRVPKDELDFALYPSECLSSQGLAQGPPWLAANWHVTSDGLGYEYRRKFQYPAVPASDIPCVLEVTEVRGGRGTTTLTISSTARVPDLSVRRPVTVSDGNPAAGQGLTLSATTRNLGTGPAAPTTLHYYLSRGDSHVGADDPVVETVAVAGLDAAASEDSVVSVAAPFSAGTYFYVACADRVHGEVYADNNCAASDVVRVTGMVPPDLVVVAAPGRSQVYPSEHFTVSVTVRNQSVAPAGDETRVVVLESTDAQLSLDDRWVYYYSVGNLAGGGESRREITVHAPGTPGRYYYGACATPVEGEVDTTNNCSAGVEVVVGDDDANRPPVAVGTLAPLSLQVEDGPRAVPVAGASTTRTGTR